MHSRIAPINITTLTVFVLATSLTFMSSCRSSKDSKFRRTRIGTTPEATPTPDPVSNVKVVPKTSLSVDRTYIQTRSTLQFTVTSNVFGVNDPFNLMNKTTNLNLISDQTLGLTEFSEDTFSLTGDGYSVAEKIIKLYPANSTMNPKFVYGSNTLLLSIDDVNWSAEKTITLRDHLLLTTGAGGFVAATQRASGLELYPAGFVQTSQSNGSHLLSVDPLEITDR